MSNKKIMINCNKASSICNKNQYCEVSFSDKLRLGIHNFLCKRCKLYSEQNTFMTKLFKLHLHKKPTTKLAEREKQDLKENLEKELDK